MKTFRHIALIAGFSLVGTHVAFCDGLATGDGSVLYGSIEKITGGNVWFKTGYSPVVKIEQKEVEFLKTDKPVHVRLAKGSTLLATLDAGPQAGTANAQTSEGLLRIQVQGIKDMWAANVEDPAITELPGKGSGLRRKWIYGGGEPQRSARQQ